MPKINVLPKQIAELIAAGEVVERPASVIKELIENSIDSGADRITVEIKRGGVSYIRVSDNGCGIDRQDVKKAFLRHSTSKIKTENDLDNILTLGFRGEALASVCAVSKVEMLTCSKNEAVGTRYCLSGGEETEFEEVGCPTGTTIVVRDLFYNTPARMKFLKKDAYEGITAAAVVDKIALSHPEIAFKFIREGKTVCSTLGNGDLKQAIYAVCGKEYHDALIPAYGEFGGISVSGYISRPSASRPNKNGIFVFLNGRFVFSKTVASALTKAYQNLIMVGKFPAAVLNLTVPAGTVDVNVHPAKTEVRFSDDKRIWDAVYFTAKNAIAQNDSRKQVDLSAVSKHRMSVDEYRQMTMADSKKDFPHTESVNRAAKASASSLFSTQRTDGERTRADYEKALAAVKNSVQRANETAKSFSLSDFTAEEEQPFWISPQEDKSPSSSAARQRLEETAEKTPDAPAPFSGFSSDTSTTARVTGSGENIENSQNTENNQNTASAENAKNTEFAKKGVREEFANAEEAANAENTAPQAPETEENGAFGRSGNTAVENEGFSDNERGEFEEQINYIGEFFATYIIASKGKSLYLIDKHAAHERIIFNDLTSRNITETQMLLLPVTVNLSAAEFAAVTEYSDLLKKAGFEVEEFGGGSVIVRSVPSMLCGDDVPTVIREAAESLLSKREATTQKVERIFETVSCRAAVKAGNVDSPEELEKLAKKVLTSREIMYCPHGRPVAVELTLKEIEKQFGRIQ